MADTASTDSRISRLFDRWVTVVARSSRPRVGKARALIEFRPEAGPSFCIGISSEGIRTLRGGHPRPSSVLSGSLLAMDQVLGHGQDITHQIASGGLSVVVGRYDDVILISRVLRHLDWDGENER